MNTNMILGSALIIVGNLWAIQFRLQSSIRALYDNWDPGSFVVFIGLIVVMDGIDRKSVRTKGWRFLGNVFVFLGGGVL